MTLTAKDLPESVAKLLPGDALKDTFASLLNEAYKEAISDEIAYAKAWLEFEKQAGGIYSMLLLDASTAKQLSDWINLNKIPNPVPTDKLHCTVVYSDKPFGPYEPMDEMLAIPWAYPWAQLDYSVRNPDRQIKSNYHLRFLGKDNRSLALCFEAPSHLWDRFYSAIYNGMNWDKDKEKIWHVTLSYDVGPDFDINTIKGQPNFDLIFTREIVEPVNGTWPEDHGLRKSAFAVKKINNEEQIVWGWANISTENGHLVRDYQGDFILTEDLRNAAFDFMLNSRRSDGMHMVKGVGTVIESIVFTNELQQVLGIDLYKEGWFIGVKIHDAQAWNMVKSGELACFSIGGKATKEPVYADGQ